MKNANVYLNSGSPHYSSNPYIRGITKKAGNFALSFPPLQKVSDSPCSCFTRDRSEKQIYYYCHICTGRSKSSLSYHELDFGIFYEALQVINYFSSFQPFLHKQNNVCISISYRYFHVKCFDELESLVPSFQTFTTKIHHSTYTSSDHPHPIPIPLVRMKKH